MLDAKIEGQFDDEKKRKRAKQYAAKKEKRRAEWEKELRAKSGVDGYAVLYEILGLPVRKLASKDAIKRAFRLQSLRYHPDRVLPEEAEEAAEKFVAVKAAYELLLEGMETGGDGSAAPSSPAATSRGPACPPTPRRRRPTATPATAARRRGEAARRPTAAAARRRRAARRPTAAAAAAG